VQPSVWRKVGAADGGRACAIRGNYSCLLERW
jgi:hypothetical protein